MVGVVIGGGGRWVIGGGGGGGALCSESVPHVKIQTDTFSSTATCKFWDFSALGSRGTDVSKAA